MIGALEPCLMDLWAWDPSMGVGVDPVTLENAILRNKLYAEISVLLYNKRYLASHGYDRPPSTLAEMQDMLLNIIINERGAENYLLTGFTSSFIR
eukprot:jgi/Hompol1/5536/HPOL_002007-RA